MLTITMNSKIVYKAYIYLKGRKKEKEEEKERPYLNQAFISNSPK